MEYCRCRETCIAADDQKLQCIALRQVLLSTDTADSSDNLQCELHFLEQTGIDFACLRHHLYHERFALTTLLEVLPQLFGDEGHEGVQ